MVLCSDSWFFNRFKTIERFWDLFITVQLTTEWRKHIVYGKKDPEKLLRVFISQFGSLSTMLSLLISSQTAVFFSPSRPTEEARTALENADFRSVAFWAGIFLCLGLIMSLLALLATLTAWSIFKVIGNKNAHVLLKSSLCLHATALPVRLADTSVYFFFIWFNLFWYVVCDLRVAIPLSAICWLGIFHISSLYSAVSRVVMYSGAIHEDERILEKSAEDEWTSREISKALIEKAIFARKRHIPVKDQYQIHYQDQLRILEEGGSLRLDELRLDEYAKDNAQENNSISSGERSKNSQASS